MEIYNRRYIGGKHKLVSNISNGISEYLGNRKFTFADPFAGTGVVAEYFAKNGCPIIVNDTLYSNYIVYEAWFGIERVNSSRIEKYLNKINSFNADDIKDNYFSEIYANKYYAKNDAKLIGKIRDFIESEKNNLSFREYCYLLSSLMYAADRIANTVGHFESFLRKEPKEYGVKLDKLNIIENSNSQIFNMDANELVKKISADVFYIDPPYNARQYVNFYHVLENLARWEKPSEFEGNSMKFKRDALKSGYSRSKAPSLFHALISDIDAKLIVVSYNNTYSAKSSASNNKISEEFIIDELSKKGQCKVVEVDYKFFNAGKTNLDNHKEKLYFCKVR